MGSAKEKELQYLGEMGSDVITGEWNYCYYLEFELDDPHKLA